MILANFRAAMHYRLNVSETPEEEPEPMADLIEAAKATLREKELAAWNFGG